MSKNPSVAGTSSTASNTSATSEESDDDPNDSDSSSEFEFLTEIAEEAQVEPDVSICDHLTFKSQFESKIF